MGLNVFIFSFLTDQEKVFTHQAFSQTQTTRALTVPHPLEQPPQGQPAVAAVLVRAVIAASAKGQTVAVVAGRVAGLARGKVAVGEGTKNINKIYESLCRRVGRMRVGRVNVQGLHSLLHSIMCSKRLVKYMNDAQCHCFSVCW